MEKNPKLKLPRLKKKLAQYNHKTVGAAFYQKKREDRFPPKDNKDDKNLIDLKELEKQLAKQLRNRPTASIVNACVRFLEIKKNMGRSADELDLEKYYKKGKDNS